MIYSAKKDDQKYTPLYLEDIKAERFEHFCQMARAANITVAYEVGQMAYTAGGDKYVTLTHRGVIPPTIVSTEDELHRSLSQPVRGHDVAWRMYEKCFAEYIAGKSVLWWRAPPAIESAHPKRKDLVRVYSRLFAK